MTMRAGSWLRVNGIHKTRPEECRSPCDAGGKGESLEGGGCGGEVRLGDGRSMVRLSLWDKNDILPLIAGFGSRPASLRARPLVVTWLPGGLLRSLTPLSCWQFALHSYSSIPHPDPDSDPENALRPPSSRPGCDFGTMQPLPIPSSLSPQPLLLLLLLVSAPLQVLAAPWALTTSTSSTGKSGQFILPQSQQPVQSQSWSLRSVFPQITWLRDTAVEKVFGLPPKVSRSGVEKSSRPSAQLPTNLLARYGGDVVLRFNITTPLEEEKLAEAADTLFLDVWEFTSNWADIRLSQDDVSIFPFPSIPNVLIISQVPTLLGLLPNSMQKAYSNLMPDLAKAIYQSYPLLRFNAPSFPPSHVPAFTPSLSTSDSVENIFFSDYQPFSVIVPWMRLMASMFTTHVRMINIGTSYEGRDIPALRIGVSPRVPQYPTASRKTIIISGGFHAREWISVSTVTYIAWSLITSYGKSPGITKLLQEFDFVVIPTTNPDGYVYTWESERLWRKNRQQTSRGFCTGLDLDRTFGFEWDDSPIRADPCSESYAGEQPFQAVESHRLAAWAKNETENHGVNFVGFLDLHSYSQKVLYPYSYSCNSYPPSLENLEELGMGLAKAIRISSGEHYDVASACEGAVRSENPTSSGYSRMETGGGSAIDWFYHELGVRYSYQIKLRDTGSYGFLLPKENIIPTGEEAFNAVKYFGDFLLGNKGIELDVMNELHQSALDESSAVADEELAVEDEAEYDMDDFNWELKQRRR